MIAGGNWWRANEIVIRHLTRQTATRTVVVTEPLSLFSSSQAACVKVMINTSNTNGRHLLPSDCQFIASGFKGFLVVVVRFRKVYELLSQFWRDHSSRCHD